MHIDQAWQNDVDYFITNENALRDAASALTGAGVTLCVRTAEHCQEAIEQFFIERYGTSDPMRLETILTNEGPILIGSNSTHQFECKDVATGELLLGIIAKKDNISVQASLRRSDGAELVKIVPNEQFSFYGPGASINLMAGPSPLFLGDKSCKSFAVIMGTAALLAGRMLRSGRFLLHHALIYSSSGHLAICLKRDALELNGVNF